MSLGPKKTEKDSKIGQSKTLKKKKPWKQKFFLWVDFDLNVQIIN